MLLSNDFNSIEMAELLASGSSYGNQFTISRQGDVDAITGKTWNGIIKNYQFVIDQISKRVRWQGTMDFAVDVLTGANPGGKKAGFGGTSWQFAYDQNDQWVHSASSEQATGVDLNGEELDLGFQVKPASSRKLKNFGWNVWIDPSPSVASIKNMPHRSQDFTSIVMHELLHSMGIAYDGIGGFMTNFKALTDVREGRVYFIGSNAVTTYGGDVPLTGFGQNGSYAHLDVVNKKGRLITVMPKTSENDFNWRTPTDLDFAILKDIGWNVI